jgi:putative DNA primase/helicase
MRGNGCLDSENYLQEIEGEDINTTIEKEPFFKWGLHNPEKLSDSMVGVLISNLLNIDIDGERFIKKLPLSEKKIGCLIKKYKEGLMNDNIIPMTYELAKQLGYEGELAEMSPADNVSSTIQEERFKNRGIKKGKKALELNANIFAKYICKRLKCFKLEKGGIHIYNNLGFYEVVDEEFIKKMCRDLLQEADEHIWKSAWEKEYFDAYKREIEYFKSVDQDSEMINLSNCMLNIKSRKVFAHSPEYMSTVQIPILYDKNAKCPKFESFLHEIFDGDEERVLLIKELMGYCFLRDVKIQKAFIFYGSGANGKSVLASIIQKLLGKDNVSNVPLKTLEERFGLAELPNKLANISGENELEGNFNTQNFKSITGGDIVCIEKKYKDTFSVKIFSKLIILCNELMKTNDQSEGYYRRLQIIPFEKSFIELREGEEKQEGISYMDTDLLKKLELEMSGILNYALDGLERLRNNDYKLTKSKKCEKLIEKYRNDQNPTKKFFEATFNIQKGSTIKRALLKKKFCEWAKKENLDDFANIGSKKFWDLFNKVLIEKGINLGKKKLKGIYYITGLEFKDLEK